MSKAPLSTAAFDELIDTLKAVRDGYLLDNSRNFDEHDVVEGYRYALQLVSEGQELFAEADPERPRFSSIVTPARKFLGDNPDAIYYQAVVRGDRSYRIRGTRDQQTYISFTVHAPDPSGGINGAVLADRNDRDFHVEADGSYEIVLSPNEHKGNWIKLDPNARLVIVRNYFLRERCAQTDPAIAINISIEPLDDPGPPPRLDDATFARRLRDASAFIHATSLGLRVFGEPSNAPFSSNEPNTVGTPYSFRQANIAAAGAVDIFYSTGPFELEDDQALIVDGTMPDCVFANLVLWNIHMQTLEYSHRRTSLNSAQIKTDAQGNFRIVIAPRDPGVPNWIDTEGARKGTMFWRFLLPSEQPATPKCRVVPLAELTAR